MTYMTANSHSWLLAGLVVLLAGCGGGSTETAQENPQNVAPELDDGDTALVYNGPSASTDDVTQFRINLWENLASDQRCGGCHNEVEGQEPMFMRRDDINLAYEATLPLVDKTAPVLSRLVEKAAEGHNVWDASTDDTIESLIARWAAATGASENTIVLTAPEEIKISETKQFPVDSALFESTVYALLADEDGPANCGRCHSESGTDERQQPFFASSNPDTAYSAARSRIDLSNPANSRFVQRMQEGHHAWSDPNGVMSNEAYSAQEVLDVITTFVNQVDVVEINPELLVSDALDLERGVVASSGGRFETDVIALYQFKEGEGSIAYDISGIEPALNLNLSPSVEWVGSWGIRIEDNGKAQGDTVSSKKLHDLIKLTGEYSVESWVIPANVTQEESRIVSYSGGTNERNFSLHQTLYDYDFLTRTANSDTNGMPLLNTPSADEVLQATLQHVVATYDPIEGRKVYVNGELVVEDASGEFAGDINDWNDTYVLAVGNEVDNAQWWEGTIRLLAIHNRVLTPEQVLTNFDAGVGQKYYLLFGVSQWINTETTTVLPEAYVVFSVEVFDDYSYLFSSPFFISLDKDAVPTEDINIRGIRIGINGKESAISQAFANIDVTVTAENYNPNTGVALSANPAGTLISLENGPQDDLFFLTFDAIGDRTYNRPADTVEVVEVEESFDNQPDVGLRIFDEIFQNLSAVTTVPSARVYDFYVEEIRRSLPSAESLSGFLASQQSAVTQLSLAYCTELIEDDTLRTAYFDDYGDLSTQAMQDALIDPLLERTLIADDGVTTHPAAADIKAKLVDPAEEGLLSKMTTNNQDTKAIAVCTAVLASAAMLMQ